MTLIVLDGKRRKLRQRALGATVVPQRAPVMSSGLAVGASSEKVSLSEIDDTPEVASTLKRSREGSRIGSATYIVGSVAADEPVLIKGQIDGAVIAPLHPVSVTVSGRVTSYIEGDRVDIDGHVLGTLKANTKAILLSGARIQGVIETPCLECVAGAWLKVEVVKKISRPNVVMKP